MAFIPYQTVTLESPLPPDEFAKRLALLVEPPKMLRWPWDPSACSFEGRIEGRRFKVRRLIKFQRNSFLPIIVGDIAPSHQGSTVRLVLRLHRFVAAFMVLWIGGVLFGGTSTVVNRGVAGPEVLFFLGFAALGYLICVVPFRIEVKRALRLLAPLASPRSSDAPRLVRT